MSRAARLSLLLFALSGCQGAIAPNGGGDKAGSAIGAAADGGGVVAAADGGASSDCASVKLGPRRLWRLTPTQYDNTLHDLLNISGGYGNGFPADPVIDNVADNSDALVVSPLLADKLSSAAQDVAGKVDLTQLDACASSQRDDACLRDLIGKFGARAFRRPLTAADGDRYFALAKQPGDFDSGARLVVNAMLQSPHFLYRFEIGSQAAGGSFQLDDYEVASELSYLLWQTMPDATLFDLASKKQLHEKTQVAAQVDRMLKSPLARPVVRGFVLDWLGLSTIPTVPKDTARFPELTDDLRASLLGEAERFVDHVMFDQDGSIASLLGSTTTFLDAKLASFYGLPLTAAGDTPQAVDLTTQGRRGILTLGGTMLVHARSNDSSPVLRGKLIREQMLCQPLPPPPVGVVVSPPPLDPTKTTRERYAAHSSVEPCMTCHQLMDPIGLSFEHFDGIGRFRADENGMPIDVSGQIISSPHSDGDFVGTDQLIDKLISSGDAGACYALQWYRWAYGFSDVTNSCLADRMQQAIGASDGSLNTIVSILTQADGFLAREGTQDSVPASVAPNMPMTTPTTSADAGTAAMATADAAPAGEPPGLTVTVTVDNEWAQGYCKTYELHNTGSTPITWSVPLDVTGTMNNHWECQVSGSTGRVTFSGESYNQTIEPDAKVQFGYCVAK